MVGLMIKRSDRWRQHEDQILFDMVRAGDGWIAISIRLQRTVLATRQRYWKVTREKIGLSDKDWTLADDKTLIEMANAKEGWSAIAKRLKRTVVVICRRHTKLTAPAPPPVIKRHGTE